jgi:4-diphosphocytidyl-2-C-methyl-D-erythritol kinase
VPEVVTAPAPAKINLVLEVLGRRDDGYHDIATVIQTLELADEVRLDFDAPAGVEVVGPFSPGVPCDESNLALRAARCLAQRLGRDDIPRISMEKNVPPAGGLGGGASDAATTLRLLKGAWRATEDDIIGAANVVGSDEAALVLGGTVRASGRGEVVDPLPPLPRHGVVLFLPPGTIERKTERLFAALDSLPFDDGAVSRRFSARAPGALNAADIFNAFERVAFDMFPGLAQLWEELERRVGEPIHLAGAGPTLFWIGPAGEAGAIAERAAGLPCSVIATRTADSLWRP